MNPDIRIQLAGREQQVLIAIGISPKVFIKPNQPCMFCSTDKKSDRASWVKNEAYYFCRSCGNHSVVDIAMFHLNLDYKDTCAYLRKNILGNVKKMPTKQPNNEAIRVKYRTIVSNCVKITPDNAGGRYLSKRGLSVIPAKDCLFHPGLEYFDNGQLIGEFPAIVSIVRTPTNESSTLHITYITEDGEKANVPAQKKIAPVIQSYKGGAIRLFQVKETLAIAEGIETALAYYQHEGIPTWSVLNAVNMACFEPPDGIKYLYIIADEDENGTGVKSAYTLFNKIKLAGVIKPCVVRILKDGVYYDWGMKMDYLDYLNSL